MKLRSNWTLCAVAAVLVLAVALLLSVFVFGEYKLFDRSGWSAAEDGTLRYLDSRGNALLGWQEVEGEVYYFSPETGGSMATGWLETDDGRYFLTEDGRKTTGWATLEGQRYYFDSSGCMQTGWLESEQGLCYLTETGAISSGWVETEEGRYFLNEEGALHTGWLEHGGNTYFLTENGTPYTGWLDTEDGRYYLKEDGTMAIGKVIIDGTARYFTSSGKYFVLVNRWNPVPEDYTANLTQLDSFQVDVSCRDALVEMVAACNEAGYPCSLKSVYRSYEYQNKAFQRRVTARMEKGYTRAEAEQEVSLSVAIPGTSEHQLGLAVDLNCGQDAYRWLAKHAWEYGYILRYPYGDTELTGILYEPWHFRYVGKELAEELFRLDLCVEAYMNMLTEQQAE